MSSVDRFQMSGKEAPPKPSLGGSYEPPVQFPKMVREQAAEARREAAKLRNRIWMEHKYDCNLMPMWGTTYEVPYPSMQPCSCYAMWQDLYGEPHRLLPFEITDGHW